VRYQRREAVVANRLMQRRLVGLAKRVGNVHQPHLFDGARVTSLVGGGVLAPEVAIRPGHTNAQDGKTV
jgi:hypothetical protein